MAALTGWSYKAPPLRSTGYAAAAVADGKLYHVGGADASFDTECYDPATNAWTTKADALRARQELAVVELGGLLYALGGYGLGGVLNAVDAYSPVADSWSARASMPTLRTSFAAAAVGGYIYAIGGYNDQSTAYSNVERFDPTANSWTSVAPLPAGRLRHAAAAIAGKIYVVGGTSPTGTVLASTDCYDPNTNTWSSRAPMPSPSYGMAAVAHGGLLYVIGGTAGGKAVWVYDPVVNSWNQDAPPMQDSRSGHAAAATDSAVYVVSYGTFEAGTFNTAPNAPTLTTLVDGSKVDVAATQHAAHQFSDPDTGDSQSAFDHRYRAIGAASWVEAYVVSPNQWVTYPAGTFADGVDYERQVRTYDAQGAVGPWSASGFFAGSTRPPAPTITTPLNGATVNQTTTVEWSAPNQGAYQVQVLDGTTVVTDTGEVVSTTARSHSLTFPDNNVTRTIRVRVKDGGLWSDWYEITVTVSYTPPQAATFTAIFVPEDGALDVAITNPAPAGEQPAAAYNDVEVLDVHLGDTTETWQRLGTMVPPNGTWRWWGPRDEVDYGPRIRVTTYAANGTSVTTTGATG